MSYQVPENLAFDEANFVIDTAEFGDTRATYYLRDILHFRRKLVFKNSSDPSMFFQVVLTEQRVLKCSIQIGLKLKAAKTQYELSILESPSNVENLQADFNQNLIEASIDIASSIRAEVVEQLQPVILDLQQITTQAHHNCQLSIQAESRINEILETANTKSDRLHEALSRANSALSVLQNFVEEE